MTQEQLRADVATLRGFAQRAEHGEAQAFLGRILAIVEPLAELSDEQAAYLVEHCTAIAECDEADARDGHDEHYDPFVGPHPAMTAGAHRTAAEVFKMLGGGT